MTQDNMVTLMAKMDEAGLQELATKYPIYAEAVATELAKRSEANAEAMDVLAQQADRMAKIEAQKQAVLKFAGKLDSNLLEGVDGQKNVLITWNDDGCMVAYNVYWSVDKAKVRAKSTRQSRDITVTVIKDGVVLERKGFSNGEAASKHYGIAKDKQGAIARLNNYKDDADGRRFLVEYGIADGVETVS